MERGGRGWYGMDPMPLKTAAQQTVGALGGFAAGGASMFWLPWLMALLSRGIAELGYTPLFRLLGMHLMATALLAGAYALLYACHLLLRPPPHPVQPFRLHFITGLLGGGLFYLLMPLLMGHPFVLVVLVVASVLVVHLIWERRRRSAGRPTWLQ